MTEDSKEEVNNHIKSLSTPMATNCDSVKCDKHRRLECNVTVNVENCKEGPLIMERLLSKYYYRIVQSLSPLPEKAKLSTKKKDMGQKPVQIKKREK